MRDYLENTRCVFIPIIVKSGLPKLTQVEIINFTKLGVMTENSLKQSFLLSFSKISC